MRSRTNIHNFAFFNISVRITVRQIRRNWLRAFSIALALSVVAAFAAVTIQASGGAASNQAYVPSFYRDKELGVRWVYMDFSGADLLAIFDSAGDGVGRERSLPQFCRRYLSNLGKSGVDEIYVITNGSRHVLATGALLVDSGRPEDLRVVGVEGVIGPFGLPSSVMSVRSVATVTNYHYGSILIVLANCLFVQAVGFFVFLCVRNRWLVVRRSDLGVCVWCGYDVGEQVSCSECGRVVGVR